MKLEHPEWEPAVQQIASAISHLSSVRAHLPPSPPQDIIDQFDRLMEGAEELRKELISRRDTMDIAEDEEPAVVNAEEPYKKGNKK